MLSSSISRYSFLEAAIRSAAEESAKKAAKKEKKKKGE